MTASTVAIISATIVGIAMGFSCALAIRDPMLTARWRYRAVSTGLAISSVAVLVMGGAIVVMIMEGGVTT